MGYNTVILVQKYFWLPENGDWKKAATQLTVLYKLLFSTHLRCDRSVTGSSQHEQHLQSVISNLNYKSKIFSEKATGNLSVIQNIEVFCVRIIYWTFQEKN